MKPFGKKRKKSNNLKRRPINVLASVMTALGLYCGIRSIFEAISQNYDVAAYFILAAIIFDMLDGTVAKMTHSTSEFGKQLDSLADLASFGVAPAVLIFTAYLHEHQAGPNSAIERTGSMIAIVYVMCGWLRLARYNVYQSEMRDSFVGLPIPAAGGTVASFVLFTQYFELNVAFWVLGPLTLTLAYLMVSTVRYPKDRVKAFVLAPKSAFRMLVMCGVIIAIFHYAIKEDPAMVLFPLGATYVMFGIVETVIWRMRQRKKTDDKVQEPSEEPSVGSPDTNTGESL